jgi:hypothetical protein
MAMCCTAQPKIVVSSDRSLQDYVTAKILMSGNSDEDFIVLDSGLSESYMKHAQKNKFVSQMKWFCQKSIQGCVT